MEIDRKKWKKKARSRDCSCVNGKDRDSNFNEVIDKLCDKFNKREKELQNKIKYLEKLLTMNSEPELNVGM